MTMSSNILMDQKYNINIENQENVEALLREYLIKYLSYRPKDSDQNNCCEMNIEVQNRR